MSLAALALGIGIFAGASNVKANKAAKADSDCLVYYAIDKADVGSYTVKVNYNRQGDASNWKTAEMTKVSDLSTDDVYVYGATLQLVYGGLGKLQFQLYDGGSWLSQEEPVDSWTSDSVFANKIYTIDNEWEDAPRKGRYVVCEYGKGTWGMENATYMEHDGEYTAEVYMEFGDVFKIAYWNGFNFSDYCGYSKMTPNASSYYCFSRANNDSDPNIMCYATGAYNFYFTDNAYDGQYKISASISGDKTAEQLAARLMGMNVNSGTCKDPGKYDVCKAMFNGLDSYEKEAFMNFASLEIPANVEDENYKYNTQMRSAYDRMAAWAVANNELLSVNGIAVQKKNFVEYNDSFASVSEAGSAALIITFTAVAGAGLLGIYLLKKKKHE